MISCEAILSIKFWPVNHVCRDKSLLEFRLDAAQAFLCLHTIAEISSAKAEVRLDIGQINRDVGEGPLKLCFHRLSVIEGFIADFHEDMDAVATERAIDGIQGALLGDEALDAAVLLNMHGAITLREGDGSPEDECRKADDALHNGFFWTAKILFFDDMQVSDESCIFAT